MRIDSTLSQFVTLQMVTILGYVVIAGGYLVWRRWVRKRPGDGRTDGLGRDQVHAGTDGFKVPSVEELRARGVPEDPTVPEDS